MSTGPRLRAALDFAEASRLGVVAAIYLVHLVVALGFAWPAARVFADAAVSHPRGDIVLFEPGAMYLSEAFRLGRAAMTGMAEGSLFAILVVSYLGLLPLAALIHALAHTGRVTLAALLASAGRFFATFSLLLGFALVTTALLTLVALAPASMLGDKLKQALGDRGHDIAQAVAYAIAGAAVAAVAVVHDLARAAAVSGELPALRAVLLASRTFRAAPWRSLAAWGLRGAAGVALVLAVAWMTYRIGVETPARFAVVTVLHQGVVMSLLWLRARWLAAALGLVQPLIDR